MKRMFLEFQCDSLHEFRLTWDSIATWAGPTVDAHVWFQYKLYGSQINHFQMQFRPINVMHFSNSDPSKWNAVQVAAYAICAFCIG